MGDRWYFEQRGMKIWAIEKLQYTYNRMFPVTNWDGSFTRDINDFHIHTLLRFVNRNRFNKAQHKFDKRGKVISGQTFDDKSITEQEASEAVDPNSVAFPGDTSL